MDRGFMEPRTALWARAEVSWKNSLGQICITPATLEDTSSSGACLRVEQPVEIGARVTVKWHRERFQAIARNCRSDGWQFVLGVQRETELPSTQVTPKEQITTEPLTAEKENILWEDPCSQAGEMAWVAPASSVDDDVLDLSFLEIARVEPEVKKNERAEPVHEQAFSPETLADEFAARKRDQNQQARSKQEQNTSGQEKSPGTNETEFVRPAVPPSQLVSESKRSVMESKGRFSKFWRSQEAVSTSQTAIPKPTVTPSAEPPAPPARVSSRGDLLSYEDIYRAAGILGSRSGYEMGKVVEMLHCERMRGLPDDVRRTSVLMAIEAAGCSVDGLLSEARERERSLQVYEASQQRHLEEFAVQKAQENAQIEVEMERVTAHYAERIKSNLAQLAREKDSLHNWQMAKQAESERIREVIELCTNSEPRAMAASASARANGTGMNSSGPSLVSGSLNVRPN